MSLSCYVSIPLIPHQSGSVCSKVAPEPQDFYPFQTENSLPLSVNLVKRILIYVSISHTCLHFFLFRHSVKRPSSSQLYMAGWAMWYVMLAKKNRIDSSMKTDNYKLTLAASASNPIQSLPAPIATGEQAGKYQQEEIPIFSSCLNLDR